MAPCLGDTVRLGHPPGVHVHLPEQAKARAGRRPAARLYLPCFEEALGAARPLDDTLPDHGPWWHRRAAALRQTDPHPQLKGFRKMSLHKAISLQQEGGGAAHHLRRDRKRPRAGSSTPAATCRTTAGTLT